MRIRQEGSVLTVDIHGLRVREAQNRLEDLLRTCPREVRQIVVIHGCNSGQALRDMVRQLQAPRLRQVKPDYFNDGQTILIL